MGSWEDVAGFLATIPGEDRARLARYADIWLPDEPGQMAEIFEAYAAENPSVTPAGLLATTGAQAGFARDLALALQVGAAALEFADTVEERQLAHVCLAQSHFQNRREDRDLAAFVENCRAAIELGHAGTFCYERLTALYEYQGNLREAEEVCRRAVEALGAAGDERSADRFRKRLGRVSAKESG